jgi:L-lactate dehydrogenase
VLPVSTLQQGVYGIDDVCLSLPTIITGRGAGQVLEIPLSGVELDGLRDSAATLRRVWETVRA